MFLQCLVCCNFILRLKCQASGVDKLVVFILCIPSVKTLLYGHDDVGYSTDRL